MTNSSGYVKLLKFLVKIHKYGLFAFVGIMVITLSTIVFNFLEVINDYFSNLPDEGIAFAVLAHLVIYYLFSKLVLFGSVKWIRIYIEKFEKEAEEEINVRVAKIRQRK